MRRPGRNYSRSTRVLPPVRPEPTTRMALMKLRLIALSLLLFVAPAFAAVPRPPQAAVASAHPLATRAGMEILDQGGNAFDAAVAVSAALSVVEPYSSGIGGGGLWLLHRSSDGLDTLVDGREYAPGA